MGHDPNFVEFNYGLLALCQGQLEESITRFKTAIKMGAEQNQAAAHVFIAHAHYSLGDYAEAAHTAETAVIEATGTGGYAHVPALEIAALASFHDGDLDAARAKVDTGWEMFGQDYPEHFAAPLALLGETEKARNILARGEARWAAGEELLWSRYFWGYFHLGELDQAFIWLERVIENREGSFLAPLRRSPLLDPIRDDPRFIAAMERLAEIEAIGTPISSVAYP